MSAKEVSSSVVICFAGHQYWTISAEEIPASLGRGVGNTLWDPLNFSATLGKRTDPGVFLLLFARLDFFIYAQRILNGDIPKGLAWVYSI